MRRHTVVLKMSGRRTRRRAVFLAFGLLNRPSFSPRTSLDNSVCQIVNGGLGVESNVSRVPSSAEGTISYIGSPRAGPNLGLLSGPVSSTSERDPNVRIGYLGELESNTG